MKSLLQIFSFLLMNLAASASATPPRYVEIFDIPVAVSDTHLFLFRSLSDNHGSHFIRETTQLLISQSLDTGSVDSQWRLDSVRENLLDECSSDCVSYQMNGDNNPIDIFKKHNAVPFVFWRKTALIEQDKYPSFNDKHYLSDQGLMENRDLPELIMPTPDILGRIAASLNPTMELMPYDNGPVNPIEYDENAYQKTLEGCITEHMASQTGKHAVYLLECEGDGDQLVNRFRIFYSKPFSELR